MGSVKDLTILQKPEPAQPGTGVFTFSDRYSVFDWGEMPNHIKNKGTALCIIGAYFFEQLEKLGVRTHYLGVVESGQPKRLAALREPANAMQVKLVRVIKPTMQDGLYNYDLYRQEKANFLIPLEVIYRNALPPGSSVFKRLQDGSLKLAELGLSAMPAPNDVLSTPILEVSTKLEATDRYLSWAEARQIAGLSDNEYEHLRAATLQIGALIAAEAARIGLFNEDGKVEYAFDENRQLMLVDVLGTPDECRFTADAIPVSKEVARIHYRQTDWFKNVEAAKKKDRVNWKQHVGVTPPPLPAKLDTLIANLYQAFCNEITQRQWFPVPPLQTILTDIGQELSL